MIRSKRAWRFRRSEVYAHPRPLDGSLVQRSQAPLIPASNLRRVFSAALIASKFRQNGGFKALVQEITNFEGLRQKMLLTNIPLSYFGRSPDLVHYADVSSCPSQRPEFDLQYLLFLTSLTLKYSFHLETCPGMEPADWSRAEHR
jgi:hypothetical protein